LNSGIGDVGVVNGTTGAVAGVSTGVVWSSGVASSTASARVTFLCQTITDGLVIDTAASKAPK